MSEVRRIDADTGEILEPEESTAIELVTPANLYGTSNPHEVMQLAAEQADVLMKVVNERKLWQTFGRSSKQYLMVEAWTFLGTMVGLFPVVKWSRALEDGSGWEARVEVQSLAGAVVGAAEAMCSRRESNWKSRDEYAIRSMAQTRATSKALRGPLSFVAVLAGFESTTAEEAQAEKAKQSKPKGEDGEPLADAVPMVTTAQIRKLMVLCNRFQWDDDTRHRMAGVESFKELTREEAGVLIERWELLETSGGVQVDNAAYGEGATTPPAPSEDVEGAGDEANPPASGQSPAPSPNDDLPATTEHLNRLSDVFGGASKALLAARQMFGPEITSVSMLTTAQATKLFEEKLPS